MCNRGKTTGHCCGRLAAALKKPYKRLVRRLCRRKRAPGHTGRGTQARKGFVKPTPPRYDALYWKGREWLDRLE